MGEEEEGRRSEGALLELVLFGEMKMVIICSNCNVLLSLCFFLSFLCALSQLSLSSSFSLVFVCVCVLCEDNKKRERSSSYVSLDFRPTRHHNTSGLRESTKHK